MTDSLDTSEREAKDPREPIRLPVREMRDEPRPAVVQVPQKYDDVLVPFLSMMRRELHANSGKGDRPGWLSMDANTALLEVYYHLSKLQKAVRKNDGPGIQEYAADVANMAMMVLDVCGGIAAAPESPARPSTCRLTECEGMAMCPTCTALAAPEAPAQGERVSIPTSEDEAAAMAIMGLNWLQERAPHRLKQTAPIPPQWREALKVAREALTAMLENRGDYTANRDAARAALAQFDALGGVE